MAKIKIIPKKDWDVLRNYLGDPGVVLIPEQAMNTMSKKQQEKLKELDGNDVDYGFGGEPTVMVDIVYDKDAYFMGEIIGEEDDDDE